MAHTFQHVHLKAKDPREAAQWYKDMFTAKLVAERDMGGAILVTVQVGGVNINISSPRPSDILTPGDSSLRYGLEHIAFGTDDLDRDLERLKGAGVKIFQVTQTPTSKGAFIEGPDNVRIELMQS